MDVCAEIAKRRVRRDSEPLISQKVGQLVSTRCRDVSRVASEETESAAQELRHDDGARQGARNDRKQSKQALPPSRRSAAAVRRSPGRSLSPPSLARRESLSSRRMSSEGRPRTSPGAPIASRAETTSNASDAVVYVPASRPRPGVGSNGSANPNREAERPPRRIRARGMRCRSRWWPREHLQPARRHGHPRQRRARPRGREVRCKLRNRGVAPPSLMRVSLLSLLPPRPPRN